MEFSLLFSYTDEQAVKIQLENCEFDKFGLFYYFITLTFDLVSWHYMSENGNTVYIEKVKRNSKIPTSIEEIVSLIKDSISKNNEFGYKLEESNNHDGKYKITILQRKNEIISHPNEAIKTSEVNDYSLVYNPDFPFTLTVSETEPNSTFNISVIDSVIDLGDALGNIFKNSAWQIEKVENSFNIKCLDKDIKPDCRQLCAVRLLFGFQIYFKRPKGLNVTIEKISGTVFTATYRLVE